MTITLATKSRSSIGAAGQDARVKRDTRTAATVAAHRLVRKSVWVVTAALSGRVTSVRVVLAVINDALYFLIKTVGMLECVTDRLAADEQIEYLQDEDTLDLARVDRAGVRVERLASLDQRVLATAGSGDVKDFPWHTGIVTGGIDDVEDGAVVAHREFSAHAVEGVDRLGMASSVVVHEVAPASVLVDVIEVGAEDVRDVSSLRSVGLEESSYVPVGDFSKILLHLGKGSHGHAYERCIGEDLHDRLKAITML